MAEATIATWNVEWRRAATAAAAIIRERLFAHDPDVICLTEAPADFLRQGGHVIEAEADYGYPLKPGRRKVLLWSKAPWRAIDQVGHPGLPTGRFIAGTTATPAGDLRVVGVCIPWSHAHVSTGRRDRAPWEDHIAYCRALEAVLAQHDRRTVVLGDFNQTIPQLKAPERAFAALDAAIL